MSYCRCLSQKLTSVPVNSTKTLAIEQATEAK